MQSLTRVVKQAIGDAETEVQGGPDVVDWDIH
jgi:hypothetical protein